MVNVYPIAHPTSTTRMVDVFRIVERENITPLMGSVIAIKITRELMEYANLNVESSK